MKKFVFFIFVVCMYTPSFANICNGQSVINNNNELLTYDATLHKLETSVSCNKTNQGNWMVGCDGKIYECKNNKWEIIKKNIRSCYTGWANASDRNKPANTISNPTDAGDIYFFTKIDSMYILENSLCRYTVNECNKDHDACIKSGRVPIQNCVICDNIAGGSRTVSNVHFKVRDESTGNLLEDVQFLYNDFLTEEYQTESIASYEPSNQYYTITWHPSNKGTIKVSKHGYKQRNLNIQNISSDRTYSLALAPEDLSSTSAQSDTTIPIEKLTPVPTTELPTCSNEIERIDITLPEVTDTNTDTGNYAENFVCVYTGGNYKDTDKTCTCDLDKHLENDILNIDDKEFKVCRCVAGYHRDGAPVCTNNDGIPVYAAHGKCIPANDYEIKIERDDMAMQRDAEDAYRNEYDNAQSWANKGTTALSTLATGEGAMMAARAIAEKIADDDAEREMAEYVSTMKCEYGGGQSVNLGDTETLPGGNEMFSYKTEFKQLAEKLKATKTALNLRPGIESEVIYDRAETGLYQYQTAERQSGGFTSLSRALINPEGADATAWNAQRAETNRDLLIGGTLATTGLVAGYAANQYVNRNHEKKYKDLTMTFTEIKEQIEQKYPEIFTPTQEEVEVRIEQQEPIPTIPTKNKKTTTETSSIPMRVSALAFKSGRIGLSPEGENALREFATEIATQSSEEDNTKITKLNIVADGYADTDPIRSDSVLRLANEYKQELNTSELPNTYNGKIEENWKLADARARKAIYFLKQIFADKLPSIEINETATGAVDKRCKGTDKTNCRYVNIRIYVTTETTVTEQN